MKTTIITILCVLAILFGAGMFAKSKFDYVTSEEFKVAHAILNQKIDSIKTQLNTVEKTVKTIEFNTDTIKSDITKLQKGQEIIYNEVRKTNVSFWDLF